MKLAELEDGALRELILAGDLLLDIQPFVARLRSDVPTVWRDLKLMYGAFSTRSPEHFADFHLELSRVRTPSSWLRPKVRFKADGHESFLHLPADQGFAMHEWALNWFVTAHAHQYMVIHAAVVEKNGFAALLPAPPGSGKSTLCAVLVNAGWRLLSDELALYDPQTGLVHGMARPVSLKNRSIDVIREFAPTAVLTRPVPDTSKGTLALMRPPDDSVRRVAEPARPAWIVMPRYLQGSTADLAPQGKAHTFMLVAEQCFNFDIHGRPGFHALSELIDTSHCYNFVYSRLDEAVQTFNELAEGVAR